MKKLKNTIQKIISKKSIIDWLIVHDISKSSPKIDNVEFSFVDGKERRNEPFKTNQGYISLETPNSVKEFKKISTELFEEFKSNPIALANLFIIIKRASFSGEDREPLVKIFKETLGKETCQYIFNLLITSLTSEYYTHHHIKKDNPANTNEWLDLFRSTEYMHGFYDPILSCLQLVRSERNRKLDFELIENMKPLLRSVLMGWYGFDLKISNKKLKLLLKKKEELVFLSACLIDDFGHDKIPPDWLSESLVETFIEKHWEIIGRQVFVHVFGLSYRNKNQNKLYEKLEDLVHKILWKKLTLENKETTALICNLKFPDDFIALFSWFSKKKIEYSKIPDSNKSAILNQFINELQKISKNLPVHLANENSSEPFSSFQLYEGKYQTALAHILLLLLSATKDNLKELTDICFNFKPLFYGGFKARSLAIHFTELILLIGLSGNSIHNLKDKQLKSLTKYLKIISDTLLIPYIHLTERDDEIWNPESEKQPFQYNAGQHLIQTALSNIRKHKIYPHYKEFFKSIEAVKVAQWGYEKV